VVSESIVLFKTFYDWQIKMLCLYKLSQCDALCGIHIWSMFSYTLHDSIIIILMA